MAFIHVSKFAEPHPHVTVDAARECEEEMRQDEYDAHLGFCSICDGIGHGYPGGGPCPLEVSEVTWFEDNGDQMMALAFG